MTYDEIYNHVVEKGWLPEDTYCDKCGCALVTEEQGHELEDLFHLLTGSLYETILIDICDCEDEQ